MQSDIKRYITVRVYTEEEMIAIRDKIEDQLIGNKDYIDGNIELSASYSEITKCYVVRLMVFNECNYIPPIVIY